MTKYTDQELKVLWDELEDIPFNEDEAGELRLAQDWHIFKTGTNRYSIWQWFNTLHSEGIVDLMLSL